MHLSGKHTRVNSNARLVLQTLFESSMNYFLVTVSNGTVPCQPNWWYGLAYSASLSSEMTFQFWYCFCFAIAEARFIRRILVASNAIQTIDNELVSHLIVHCLLNCIRCYQNSTFETELYCSYFCVYDLVVPYVVYSTTYISSFCLFSWAYRSNVELFMCRTYC